jgi:dsDNA-specific endonuclease/ATPase MutS2
LETLYLVIVRSHSRIALSITSGRFAGNEGFTAAIIAYRRRGNLSINDRTSEEFFTVIAAEIHLRRLTVDEALLRLDRFLNEVFVAGLPWVRVIHGKGTGTLRYVVREELGNSPLVKSFRSGRIEEGGSGATIVEMANQ